MKNRTIIGIVCIVLALVVTFAVAPLVNKLSDSRTDIVRLKNDIVQGHLIQENDIEVVTVGSTGLPTNIITKKEEIVTEFLTKQKCYFYDTCSFRRHTNLKEQEANYLLKYLKIQDSIVVITRCILMELASHSGILNQEYITYIKHIAELKIPVLVIYEEDLFDIMEVCFSTNATINNYLCWTMRTMKLPISTITKTLEQNSTLYDQIIKGKNLLN